MSIPRLYLAPLQGITDVIFRNTYCRYFAGFDLAVAPFIPTGNARRIRENRLRDVLPERNLLLPVVPQIMSGIPEDFILLANRLHDIGHEVVNWNLGCPFPMVIRKRRGAGLLPYPEQVAAFLDTVTPRIPNRISIKTRLGMNNETEIHKLLPIFNQYPLAEIIVHPRTAKQMYTGSINLTLFAECLAVSRHPMIYNGDIVDLASFERLAARFATAGWMIGRGAVADPFLPGIIKSKPEAGLPPVEKAHLIRAFHDELINEYAAVYAGPGHVIGRMKEVWSHLSASFENGRKFFKRIRKANKWEQYQRIIEEFFVKDGVWIR